VNTPTPGPSLAQLDNAVVSAGSTLARGIAPGSKVLAFDQGSDPCVTPTHDVPPTKAPVSALPSTGEGTGSTAPPTPLLLLLGGVMLLGGGSLLMLRGTPAKDDRP